VKETARDTWGWRWVEDFFEDIRFGFRMLRKSSGFTIVAILTLALGIGVNTSVFSLMDFVLLRPLPVPDPGRVTVLSRGGSPLFSYPDYDDYRDRNQSFTALAASVPTESSLDYQGESRATAAEAVSGNYNDVMKIQPLLGRWFTDENENVAVISYDAWQRIFAADANVLGKHVRSESQWYSVIGVAPPDFTGIYSPIRTDIWVPLRIWTTQHPNLAAERTDRMRRRVMLFGRLKDAIEPFVATANLQAIDEQIHRENPGIAPDKNRILVERASGIPSPISRRNAVPVLILLFGVVGAVLLIACVNVGNLLVARGVVRRHELSVRTALGAGRSRLLRQLLTECLLLCFMGAAAGLVFGSWTNHLLKALLLSLPIDAPIQLNLALDYRVFLFAAALSILAALMCGLLPAWRAASVDVAPVLKGESSQTTRFHMRHAFLAGQIALSLVLLLCAGLFLRSIAKLQSSDPGFAVKNRLYALTYISEPEFNAESGLQFYSKLLTDLRSLPGVQRATLTRLLPLRGQGNETNCVSTATTQPFSSTFGVIDSGFLTEMQIPVLQGREFDAQDQTHGKPVAVINVTLAQRLWPHQNAIGQSILLGCDSKTSTEVVGVAADTKVVSLGEAPQPYFYLPFSQNYTGLVTLVLKTASESTAFVSTVREALHKENNSLRIYGLETLSSHLERSYYQVRWESSMLLIFGLVALLLATVGIYGAIAYYVTQRTREIGLRMAIGARPAEIGKLILSQGLRVAGLGISVGLVVSLGVARLLGRFLSGLNPLDPLSFISTAILWSLVAAAACYLPARRAMRVDPMVALRHE
jgi:predicted permease